MVRVADFIDGLFCKRSVQNGTGCNDPPLPGGGAGGVGMGCSAIYRTETQWVAHGLPEQRSVQNGMGFRLFRRVAKAKKRTEWYGLLVPLPGEGLGVGR